MKCIQKTNYINDIDIYRNRRDRLIKKLYEKGGGVAILSTAERKFRNRDITYPYRHDSYFYYLTGFTEPNAVLVLNASSINSKQKSILFCREKNHDLEIWEGFYYGPDSARDVFGVDAAFATDLLDDKLPGLLEEAGTVYYCFSSSGDFISCRLNGWLNKLRYGYRSSVRSPNTLCDLSLIIDDMRLIKDKHELEIMRSAAKISALAHRYAMIGCHPGIREYELEAELLRTFRMHGAQSPAYESIVAAGSNACVLHHLAGNSIACNGDLILIDAACELNGYASDITRTFPVNGRFSATQRILYDIVLSAQQAAIDTTRADISFDEPHNAAIRIIVQGLLDTGIISKTRFSDVDSVIAERAYIPFYMHRTGHWIGMDVHDCDNYYDHSVVQQEANNHIVTSKILKAGMVLTIEPGLYVRASNDVPEEYWNIGIRIEDSAIIREYDCELITRDVPVNADEIEDLMLRA
ncbi:MAG: aminopeptidase P N-terminal domain-containing protein [Burkholderia sp.]|nr:aminopeptidase P N-terminal domain-containing protein [Burkholderia sp.]